VTTNGIERLVAGATWYAEQGWKVLLVHGLRDDGKCTCNKQHKDSKDAGKHAVLNDWQNSASSDPNQISAWWRLNPLYNPAVMAKQSGFITIDIDPRSGGDESFMRFEELVEGSLTKTVEAITGEYTYKGKTVRGRHMYYKVADGDTFLSNLDSLGLKGIDIKHNGYVLLPPARHFSGVTYEWKPGHAPWEIGMADAPEELLGMIRKKAGRSSGGSRSTLGKSDWSIFGDLDFSGEKVDVERLLTEGIDEGARAVDIYKLACALANKMGTSNIARQSIESLMIRFNHEKVRPPMELEGPNSLLLHTHRAIDFVAANPKSDMHWPGSEEYAVAKAIADRMAGERSRELVTYEPDPEHRADSDSIFGSDEIISPSSTPGEARIKDVDALTVKEGGDPTRRSLTDTGNGRRLVDAFGSIVRYSPGLGYFNFTGGYWKPDAENLATRELCKRLAPVIASEVGNYEDTDSKTKVTKWASDSKSNARLSNAMESATSDPRIIVDVESWDADSEMLGVANGVINLRTGELLRGRRDLYITRRAPVAYTPGIKNKRWDAFLDVATGGDKEFQEWLQKAAGYTLTGLRTHDVMFLVYGPGGSGKNVLVESIVKVLGTQQYAWPMDSQILAQGDGHASSADLYHWAELRGRRMIWVDELPESERLKENSVKKLTGSNEISARSPGEKPFTFSSRGKLWITTNHRPIINDDAMWRRIRPIPWLNVPAVPDPGLKDFLFDPEGGLPAVLAWAVEGAVKIINSTEPDSLGWCAAVTEAAEVYRKNEDRIGMFLNEETTVVPGSSLPIKIAFPAYKMWSDERGEKPMSQIALQRKLTDRGLEIRGTGGRAEIMDRTLVLRTADSGMSMADLASLYGPGRF